MNSDIIIIQNDRTRQTWLYCGARHETGLVEATEKEFDILKGLAGIIRAEVYDNQKIVDEISRLSQELND